MGHDAQQSSIRLALAVFSLGIGLFAANLALFNWIERIGLNYLLGNYARYVCAYGGFGAMIFGAMIVQDFFVRREFLKRRYAESELKTLSDVRKRKATRPTADRRPRKKVSKTVKSTAETI